MVCVYLMGMAGRRKEFEMAFGLLYGSVFSLTLRWSIGRPVDEVAGV